MDVEEYLLEFLILKGEQQEKTVTDVFSKMYTQISELQARISRASRGYSLCESCGRCRERIKRQKALLALQREQIQQAHEILQAYRSSPIAFYYMDDYLRELDRLTAVSKVLATQHVELYAQLDGARTRYEALINTISENKSVLADCPVDSLLRLTTLQSRLQKRVAELTRELRTLKTRVNVF